MCRRIWLCYAVPNGAIDQGIDHLQTVYIRLSLWSLQSFYGSTTGHMPMEQLHWIYDGATTFLWEARQVAKQWACWSKTAWQGVPQAQPHIRFIKEDPPGTPWHGFATLCHERALSSLAQSTGQHGLSALIAQALTLIWNYLIWACVRIENPRSNRLLET